MNIASDFLEGVVEMHRLAASDLEGSWRNDLSASMVDVDDEGDR